jgi:hypothetical protein
MVWTRVPSAISAGDEQGGIESISESISQRLRSGRRQRTWCGQGSHRLINTGDVDEAAPIVNEDEDGKESVNDQDEPEMEGARNQDELEMEDANKGGCEAAVSGCEAAQNIDGCAEADANEDGHEAANNAHGVDKGPITGRRPIR